MPTHAGPTASCFIHRPSQQRCRSSAGAMASSPLPCHEQPFFVNQDNAKASQVREGTLESDQDSSRARGSRKFRRTDGMGASKHHSGTQPTRSDARQCFRHRVFETGLGATMACSKGVLQGGYLLGKSRSQGKQRPSKHALPVHPWHRQGTAQEWMANESTHESHHR